jgi:predicted kinase
VLIVLSGLPGVGKTTIARALARAANAVHIRIDSIEQALREAGVEVEAEGYRVAYAIAEDNLRLGHHVIADCVNPWPLTRREWRAVAERAGVPVLDVECVCSDLAEHRRRVDTREPDIPGHRLPTWAEVIARDYRPWTEDRLVIDTAHATVDQAVTEILAQVQVLLHRMASGRKTRR